MLKKLFSILLALTVSISILPMTVSAESTFKDMPNDWSTQALENAVKNELLKGANGKISPNSKLTRAEMATIINRSFKATKEGSISQFIDVSSNDWYYDQVAKAIQMETFKGDDKRFNPNKSISREEAFLVISRAFKVDKSSNRPSGYTDLSDLSSWAEKEVYGLIQAGYVKGSGNKINPKATITRAEFAQLMHNIVKEYISTPGVYTSAAKGNIMINTPGVTLENLTIDGDLIVGEGVASGNLTLDNVNIEGRLVVRGGGEESIIIKGDSKVAKAVVSRLDGSVAIKAEDQVVIGNIVVKDGSDKVIIKGNVKDIEVETNQVQVILRKSEVENIRVRVPKAKIQVEEDSKVDKIVVQAERATIEGKGKVEKVEVKKGADDSTIKTRDTKIEVAKGVSGTIGTGNAKIQEDTKVENNSDIDKKPTDIIKEDKKSSGGGGGGGGSSSGGSSGGSSQTPSDTKEDKLAKIIAEKVTKLTHSEKDANISFDKEERQVTIEIKNGQADIVDTIIGTNAINILVDTEEVTGYEDYEFAGKTKSKIKQDILTDAWEKLDLKATEDGKLEEIQGKKITVKVKATIDDEKIEDTYTFTFK